LGLLFFQAAGQAKDFGNLGCGKVGDGSEIASFEHNQR
jgi:hypothetical protein